MGFEPASVCICSQCIHPLDQSAQKATLPKNSLPMLTHVKGKLKLNSYPVCTSNNIKKLCSKMALKEPNRED